MVLLTSVENIFDVQTYNLKECFVWEHFGFAAGVIPLQFSS